MNYELGQLQEDSTLHLIKPSFSLAQQLPKHKSGFPHDNSHGMLGLPDKVELGLHELLGVLLQQLCLALGNIHSGCRCFCYAILYAVPVCLGGLQPCTPKPHCCDAV